MFKKRNRAWLAVCWPWRLSPVSPPKHPQQPPRRTARRPDRRTQRRGVLLSWDAPDETVDSWQVLRKIHPAETAHTVVATVDGELNEWTDTDLTAGDRRYKVAAVRDSLTSRLSRVAKLMLDEPPPPRPTPGTITPSPGEGAPDREGGRRNVYPCCEHRHCHARHVDEPRQRRELGAVTLAGTFTYQIYVEKTESGRSTIDFVCGPDELEIANTTAAFGTGLGSTDALLNFVTPAAAGLHYVKITTTGVGSKRVFMSYLGNDEIEPVVPVGGIATGTFGTPIDTDGVEVPMVKGTTYQIDVRSVGYPGIDPWIIDIYDDEDRITRTGRCDYTNTPPTCTTFFGRLTTASSTTDSGPGNAARGHLHRDQVRRPPHQVRQPRRTESAAGRLASASDRGVCPVLRRLRGGRFHQRHRGCGRLCVGRD